MTFKYLPCAAVLAIAPALAAGGEAGVEKSMATQSPASKPEAKPAKKPRVLITISKETTRIMGPLRPDGYVDYVAALDERCRQGVTPENNSAVLMWRAMGPKEIPEAQREQFFKQLGIPPLPEKGHYYVDIDSYVKFRRERQSDREDVLQDDAYNDFGSARPRPWSKKEFPLVADWLAANEKPLALVLEATKRPRRYDPLIGGKDGMVISVLPLPSITMSRAATRGVIARAMLRVREGEVDDAWQDLLACHRLARLTGEGPTLVEGLVALTIDGIASAGDAEMLQHSRLTAGRAIQMRDDLIKLPPIAKMAEKIDVAERYMFLDIVSNCAREGLSSLRTLTDGKPLSGTVKAIDETAAAAIDWDKILRMGNSWYDRLVAACGKPTRAQRMHAINKFEDDIHKLGKKAREKQSLLLSVLLGDTRDAVSEHIANMVLALLLPAVSATQNAEDRGAMRLEMTRLAFSLAAYRADHGSYPAKLADVVPRYAPEVPKDLFTGGELHYHRQGEGEGYLLYSVGPNGRDDGGKRMEDVKDGEGWDDIVVRITK